MKEKTFVFELIDGITNYVSPGDEIMKKAEVLYNRYLEYMETQRKSVKPITLAQFLLTKIERTGFDSFTCPKGTLVKVKANGLIGMVSDWRLVGCSSSHVEVAVQTAKGESCYRSDQIEKADIPTEVLEYVASTLKDKVHGKVDEAFENKEQE